MKIGIVGAGLVGGSLYLKWEKTHEVLLWDKGDIPVSKTPLAEIAAKADIIWVATNPRAVSGVANELFALGAKLVADVNSVKSPVINGIEPRFRDRFIACHPMAGSEKTGFKNAREDVMANATWAICSEPRPEDLILVSSLISLLQGQIIFTDPGAHDRAVAASSHLIQILQTKLAESLLEQNDLSFYLSGPGLYDSTRLAGSGFTALWQEIIEMNKDNIKDAAEDLNLNLSLQGLPESWARGRAYRERLISKRWRAKEFKTITIDEKDFWRTIKDHFWETPVKNIRRVSGEIKFDVIDRESF